MNKNSSQFAKEEFKLLYNVHFQSKSIKSQFAKEEFKLQSAVVKGKLADSRNLPKRNLNARYKAISSLEKVVAICQKGI